MIDHTEDDMFDNESLHFVCGPSRLVEGRGGGLCGPHCALERHGDCLHGFGGGLGGDGDSRQAHCPHGFRG